MIKKLFKLFGNQRNLLYKTLLLKTIESLFLGSGFGFIYLTIKNLLDGTLSHQIALHYLIGFFASLVIAYLINNIQKYKLQIQTYPIFASERIKLANHINKLPMGFFNKKSAGELSNTLTESLRSVEPSTVVYAKLISVLSFAVIFLVMSLFFNLLMTLAMFIGFPLAFFILIKDMHITEQGLLKRQLAQGLVSEATVDFISGIKEAKMFAKSAISLKTYQQEIENFRSQNLKLEKHVLPKAAGYQLAVNIGFIPISVLGAYLVLVDGVLGLPIYLLYLLATLKIYVSLQELAGYALVMKHAGAGLTNIHSVYKHEPLLETTRNNKIKTYNIEFNNVSFAYEKEQVLKKINFQVQQNTITALMGPSGSGKTTITNLIARFWDITEGEIMIGGINIKDVKTSELLSKVSMVFQNVYLFNDTVANNIKMGKQDATDEEVIAAAKKANCHNFIMKFTDKYESFVGEGGNKLSGGEKQRISIARAFLKNSPVILLDEATANIDPANEMIIQSSINKLVKDKTVIVIAHKLSTIKKANQVLVFNNGEIVQRGTHKELSQADGGIYNDYRIRRQRAKGWKIAN